jgi:hypothetical protein
VAIATALLNILLAPAADGVEEVYNQLKDILGIAAMKQSESSLQRWAKVSISSPSRSKAGW